MLVGNPIQRHACGGELDGTELHKCIALLRVQVDLQHGRAAGPLMHGHACRSDDGVCEEGEQVFLAHHRRNAPRIHAPRMTRLHHGWVFCHRRRLCAMRRTCTIFRTITAPTATSISIPRRDRGWCVGIVCETSIGIRHTICRSSHTNRGQFYTIRRADIKIRNTMRLGFPYITRSILGDRTITTTTAPTTLSGSSLPITANVRMMAV
mmetsp:Transcript_9833/g.16206  ORF Transcript_9833/g.16206 Transcript_9833/m.16206 type:complete len:208 (+) Transcript_9833:1386-2009(+)